MWSKKISLILSNFTFFNNVFYVNCISKSFNPFLNKPAVQFFWKHCGKRRNCSLQAISPFPSVFSTLLENFQPFSSTLKLSSALSLVWKSLKLVVWERDNSHISVVVCDFFEFGTVSK